MRLKAVLARLQELWCEYDFEAMEAVIGFRALIFGCFANTEPIICLCLLAQGFGTLWALIAKAYWFRRNLAFLNFLTWTFVLIGAPALSPGYTPWPMNLITAVASLWIYLRLGRERG